MNPEEYVEKVKLHAGNNDYETVDTDSDLFDAVVTKKKLASYLDNGMERRFVAVGVFDNPTVATVNEGIEELQEIADENVKVDSAGGLATKPLIPIFATASASDNLKETVSSMDAVTNKNMRIPVVAEISDGGMMSSAVSLTYPIPPRRKLPRRRAVKKVVSSLADV